VELATVQTDGGSDDEPGRRREAGREGLSMTAQTAGARGEEAPRRWDIPKRGWKDVLLRVKDEINRDNLSIVAAGVAFYALFAIFPAISALVTVYGLLTDPAELEQQLAPVRDVFPEDAFAILQEQTRAVVSKATGSLSLGLIASLALAVWSANKGTKAIFTALNIAYGEREKRGFISLNAWSLAFTLGGVLFVVISLLIIAAVPAAVAIFGYTGGIIEFVLLALRWAVMAVLMMVALALLYRYGPSRATARIEWVSPGAIVATALWLLGSAAFSLYVSNFGSYDKTFGSLGAVVILLMWFYISAYVVCLGAELNAELERQTRRDSTTGPEKPIGQRGAYVAHNKPT
jgi:membrane protein